MKPNKQYIAKKNQQDHQEVEMFQGQGEQKALLEAGVGDVDVLFL